MKIGLAKNYIKGKIMENKLKFKIDEKSLFYGVKNDYEKGHTATVSTPLNQSKDPKKWRMDILKLKECNCRVNNIPEMLEFKCKQSFHSGNSIDDIFVFSNIFLDGEKLNTKSQFVMYMKRETDKIIRKLNGTKGKNTHYGRIKFHYPINFIYKSDGYHIDNNEVLNSILKQNGGFAFMVKGFEYSNDTKILNFITSAIGQEGIPLSTVFRIAKGTGKKLRIDPNKVLENNKLQEIVDDNTLSYEKVPYQIINDEKNENGKLGEKIIFDRLSNELSKENELYHTSEDYNFSPYDMEYIENDKKIYVEVKATKGTKKIFNMSSGEFKFMENHKETYKLYLVTQVKDAFPIVYLYYYKDIIKMKKEYPRIVFYA